MNSNNTNKYWTDFSEYVEEDNEEEENSEDNQE